MVSRQSLLEVTGLEVVFRTSGRDVPAVRGVDFNIAPGETLAIVGESGSGKSATALATLGLLPINGRVRAGSIRFDGVDLLRLRNSELCRLRGSQIGFVPQDPHAALNPLLTIGRQMIDAIRAHESVSRGEASRRAVELLDLVRLPRPQTQLSRYPHEMSGGMKQRVMVAIAMACRPKLIIADEPTTALDVTVQAQLLRLVRQIQAATGVALLWITHDLGVVRTLAQSIAVMYAGRIVEIGPVDSLFTAPRHPYTAGLLGCIPDVAGPRRELHAIPGEPANARTAPVGCAFAPRCSHASAACREQTPTLDGGPSGRAACWHPLVDSRSPTGVTAHDERAS